jgi:hypothetical protein
LRQAALLEAETLAVLRGGRNLELRVAFERRHAHLAAERGDPWLQLMLVQKIVALDAKIRD